MATLPLFTNPPANAHPYSSRRVIAPGGTELWSFDAEDSNRGLQLELTVCAGNPSDPQYQREVSAFLKKPTVRLPPNPKDHAYLSIEIMRAGNCIVFVNRRVPPSEFFASAERLDVRCGPLQVTSNGEPIRVACDPFTSEFPAFDLTFTPTTLSQRMENEQRFPAEPTIFFRTIVTATENRVTGSIRPAGAGTEAVKIDGRGTHGYGYATSVTAFVARNAEEVRNASSLFRSFSIMRSTNARQNYSS